MPSTSVSLTMTLAELHAALPALGPGWSDQTLPETPISQIRLAKIAAHDEASTASTQPLVVSHSLLVDSDLSWNVFVHGRRVHKNTTNPLSGVPDKLDPTSLAGVI